MPIFSADLLIISAKFSELDQYSVYMFRTVVEYIFIFSQVPRQPRIISRSGEHKEDYGLYTHF